MRSKFNFLQTSLLVFLLTIFLGVSNTAQAEPKDPPSFPQSALTYMQQERHFIADFVHDEDGGFSFWVERDGTTTDHRKLTIFQANIILWIGGIHSQDPIQEDAFLIRSAADYMLENLYGGDGYWYESYNLET